MTRRVYPDIYESYVQSIEAAMPEGWNYVGKGCACTGSPLVYHARSLKIEIWPLRKFFRVSRNNTFLHVGGLHTPDELRNLLKNIEL